jgi:hypothetical protein
VRFSAVLRLTHTRHNDVLPRIVLVLQCELLQNLFGHWTSGGGVGFSDRTVCRSDVPQRVVCGPQPFVAAHTPRFHRISPCIIPVSRDNGMLYDKDQLGYLLSYYHLVGPVKLRQARVTNTSCNERRFLGFRAFHPGACAWLVNRAVLFLGTT